MPEIWNPHNDEGCGVISGSHWLVKIKIVWNLFTISGERDSEQPHSRTHQMEKWAGKAFNPLFFCYFIFLVHRSLALSQTGTSKGNPRGTYGNLGTSGPLPQVRADSTSLLFTHSLHGRFLSCVQEGSVVQSKGVWGAEGPTQSEGERGCRSAEGWRSPMRGRTVSDVRSTTRRISRFANKPACPDY